MIDDMIIIHKIPTVSPIAGNEWSIGIGWRYYTSTAKPTVALHAKDVARQAAVACTTVRGDVGDGD